MLLPVSAAFLLLLSDELFGAACVVAPKFPVFVHEVQRRAEAFDDAEALEGREIGAGHGADARPQLCCFWRELLPRLSGVGFGSFGVFLPPASHAFPVPLSAAFRPSHWWILPLYLFVTVALLVTFWGLRSLVLGPLFSVFFFCLCCGAAGPERGCGTRFSAASGVPRGPQQRCLLFLGVGHGCVSFREVHRT